MLQKSIFIEESELIRSPTISKNEFHVSPLSRERIGRWIKMGMSMALDFRSMTSGGLQWHSKKIDVANRWLIKNIFMFFGLLQICGGLRITDHHIKKKRWRGLESSSVEGHNVLVVWVNHNRLRQLSMDL